MQIVWKRSKLGNGPLLHKARGCMFSIIEWRNTGRFQITGWPTLYRDLDTAAYYAVKMHDRKLVRAAKLLKRYKLLTEGKPNDEG